MNIENVKNNRADFIARKVFQFLSLVMLLALLPVIIQAQSINEKEQFSLLANDNITSIVEQVAASSISAIAAENQAYYVNSLVRRSGNGSAASPFRTIQEGVDAAQPGDIVWVAAGEYDGMIQTVRNGENDRPITIRSNPPVQVPFGAAPGWTPDDESQRVWIRREGRGISFDHSHIVIDGINVDGLWHGDAFIDKDGIIRDPSMNGQWVSGTNGIVRVAADAKSIVMRNIEVKNNQRHMLTIYGESVVLDNAKIHHAIARTRDTRAPEPGIVTGDDSFRDAHGIEASNSKGLTITNTYIGYVSGDCVQLGRSVWGDFLVENSHFELAPLDEPVLGLAAGTWFGEDHFDTKTPDRGQNGAVFNKNVTFRNSILNGTKYSRYENGAVLNSKEGVENIVFEGNVVYDNRMTLRLRRPTTGYVIRNNTFYNNETVIWFAGPINNVQIINNTFSDNDMMIRGDQISNVIIAANIFTGRHQLELDDSPVQWQHNMFYQVPSGFSNAVGKTGLIADPLFVDRRNGDFRLQSNSPAIPLGIGARPVIIQRGSKLSNVWPAN